MKSTKHCSARTNQPTRQTTWWTWRLIGARMQCRAARSSRLNRQNCLNSPTTSTTSRRKTRSNFPPESLKRSRRSSRRIPQARIKISQRWRSQWCQTSSSSRPRWRKPPSTAMQQLRPKLNRREKEIKWWSCRYKTGKRSADSSRRRPRTSWTDLAPCSCSTRGSTSWINRSRDDELPLVRMPAWYWN